MDYELLKQAVMQRLGTNARPLGIAGLKQAGPLVASQKQKFPAAPKLPKGVKSAGGLVQDNINSFTRSKLR